MFEGRQVAGKKLEDIRFIAGLLMIANSETNHVSTQADQMSTHYIHKHVWPRVDLSI